MVPDRHLPRFIALGFPKLHRHCVSYRLRVCGDPTLGRSVGTTFPKAFADSVSLCHMLGFLAIFQTFYHYSEGRGDLGAVITARWELRC